MKLQRYTRNLLIIVSAILVMVPLLFAKRDETKELEKRIVSLNNEAKAAADEAVVSNVISEELDLKPEVLKKAKAKTGLNWGELFTANDLAKAGGKSFDQIVTELKSGKAIGEIANESNLKLGELIRDLKRAEKRIKREKETEEVDTKMFDQMKEEMDALASSPGGEDQLSGALSQDLGVSQDDLKKQKKENGLTWGQVAEVDALAKATGKSCDEIMSELKSGRRFSDIASESNLRIGQIASELRNSDRMLNQQREIRMTKERRDAMMGPSANRAMGGGTPARGGTAGGAGSGRGRK